MLNLTPQRRAAITSAGGAAAALLVIGTHSVALHFCGGLLIGASLAINVGALIRGRRSCSP